MDEGGTRRALNPLLGVLAVAVLSCGRASEVPQSLGVPDWDFQATVVMEMLPVKSQLENGVPLAFRAAPELMDRVFSAARERGWPLVAWEHLGDQAKIGVWVEQLLIDNMVSGRILWSSHGELHGATEVHWESYWVTTWENGIAVVGPDRLLSEEK